MHITFPVSYARTHSDTQRNRNKNKSIPLKSACSCLHGGGCMFTCICRTGLHMQISSSWGWTFEFWQRNENEHMHMIHACIKTHTFPLHHSFTGTHTHIYLHTQSIVTGQGLPVTHSLHVFDALEPKFTPFKFVSYVWSWPSNFASEGCVHPLKLCCALARKCLNSFPCNTIQSLHTMLSSLVPRFSLSLLFSSLLSSHLSLSVSLSLSLCLCLSHTHTHRSTSAMPMLKIADSVSFLAFHFRFISFLSVSPRQTRKWRPCFTIGGRKESRKQRRAVPLREMTQREQGPKQRYDCLLINATVSRSRSLVNWGRFRREVFRKIFDKF